MCYSKSPHLEGAEALHLHLELVQLIASYPLLSVFYQRIHIRQRDLATLVPVDLSILVKDGRNLLANS